MTWTGTAGLSQTETSVFAERPSTGTTDNYNDKEKGKQNRANEQTRGSHAGENGARRPGRVTYHPSQELRINGSKIPPAALSRSFDPAGLGVLQPRPEPPSPSWEPPWPGELREEQADSGGRGGGRGERKQ